MKRTTILLLVATLFISSSYAIGVHYDKNQFEVKPTSVNTEAYEFGISYYRDNTVVFFKTNPDKDINDNDLSKSGITIYKAQIASNGDLINAEICQELMDLGVGGSFAYDKQQDKIYFSRYNKINHIYQLFESTYQDGKWDTPQPVQIEGLIPSRMNTSAVVNANWDYLEKGASIVQPSLAKNGTRIYFTSNMKHGEGKTDIWYIDYNGTTWDAPVNMGKQINTIANEQYPYAVGDSVLYYASNASGSGKYDLFVARITEGQDTLAHENMGDFFNSERNEYNLIANGNTLYFVADRDDQNDQIMYVKPKLVIIPPIIALQESAPEKEEKEFSRVLFYFDFDKTNLKAEFEAQLEQIIEDMNQFPGQKYQIAGYTDSRGSDQYNDKLSLKRAKTVQDMLIKRGISKDMLVVKAYGKQNPAIENAQTEDEHAQNRRVEITFYNEK